MYLSKIKKAFQKLDLTNEVQNKSTDWRLEVYLLNARLNKSSQKAQKLKPNLYLITDYWKSSKQV